MGSEILTDLNCKREYARMKVKLDNNLAIIRQEYNDFIPSIEFSADKTNIIVGEKVTFTLSGLLGNEPIIFLWDFSDIGTSNIVNISHVYSLEGNYTVSATVSDKNLQIDKKIKINYIIVNTESENAFLPPPKLNNDNIILISVALISGGLSIIIVVGYIGKRRTKRKKIIFFSEFV